MANTIKLKRGSGSDPGASDLSVGELAIRTDEGKIFTKKDDGSVAEISGGGGVSDGDKGDITVSNSGATWTIDSSATQVANKLPLAGGTLTGDLNLGDEDDINIGAGVDLKIYSDGSTSFLKSDDLRFRSKTSSHNFINCFESNGLVQLFHSNNLKLATASGGVTVTGTCTATTFAGSGASLTSLPAGQLTGTVAAARLDTATTQSAGNNSTKIATTAYTDTAISNLIDSSPSTLNTLNELAAALGDDANFSTTVTNSIATKLPLAGGTLTGNVKLNDSIKTIFGSDDDAYMMHNGSHQYNRCSTGYYHIQAQEIRFNKADGNETLLKAISDGAVELYHNNFKSFKTAADGIFVYGPEGGDGILKLYADEGDDNADKWRFVSGTDGSFYLQNFAGGTWEKSLKASGNGNVELYYNHSKKFETTTTGTEVISTTDALLKVNNTGDGTATLMLHNTGSTDFQLALTNAVLTIGTTTEASIKATANGAVELYYDGTKKFETRSDGILVSGNIQLNDSNRLDLGNNGDLRLYHDGSNSYITNSTGIFLQRADDIRLQNSAGSEVMLDATANGAVNLYYDNSKKFHTTNYGAVITGKLFFADGSSAIDIGDASDLKLWHNGTNSHLENSTNTFYIRSDLFSFQSKTSSEQFISCAKDGAVELYYDNTKKFETISEGAKVHGHLRFDDSKYIKLGTSADVQMFHNGSNFHIQHLTSGSTYIDSVGNHHFRNAAGNAYRAKFVNNGAVELYFNNSKKFETNSSGVFVKSTLQIEEESGSEYYRLHTNGYGGLEIQNETTKVCEFTDASTLDFPDNNKIQLGTGQDLQIYHDGTRSHIYNTTGDLRIRSDDVTIRGVNDEICAAFYENSSVELFHNNTKRFETTTGGANVTGELTTDKLVVQDDGEGSPTFTVKADDHSPWAFCVGNDSYSSNAQHGLLGYQNNNGSFHMRLQGNSAYEDFTFTQHNGTTDRTLFTLAADGGGKLYYAGSERLVWGSTACDIRGGGNHRVEGHLRPWNNNTYDLGTTGDRWRNLYINDLQLSNEGSKNDVDGTWGDWTLQEGESDVFMINNRSGKKYKIALQEVS